MKAGIIISRADPELFDEPGQIGSLLLATDIPSICLVSLHSHRCKIILISGFGEKVA
jgi:hypothetical protein